MNIYCFSTLSFAKLQFKSVINKVFHKHGVASFTDAWIETCLKTKDYETVRESHLLQMRGLKRFVRLPLTLDAVASFTDAWIETLRCFKYARISWVASFTDAWIETKEMRHQYRNPGGRIFYRCVD